MRMAATTPVVGWCGHTRSRMKPAGIDQSMAQAVVRHGTYELASFLVAAAQATTNGRISSGIDQAR